MLGSEQEHFCVLTKELQEITNSPRTEDKRFRVQQLGVISSGPSPFIGCPLPGTTTTSLCLATSDPTTSSWALQVISPNMGEGRHLLFSPGVSPVTVTIVWTCRGPGIRPLEEGRVGG